MTVKTESYLFAPTTWSAGLDSRAGFEVCRGLPSRSRLLGGVTER